MTAPDAALNEVHKLGCELSESFRKYLGTNLKPKNFWRACNLGSDWLDRNSEGVFKKLQYDVVVDAEVSTGDRSAQAEAPMCNKGAQTNVISTNFEAQDGTFMGGWNAAPAEWSELDDSGNNSEDIPLPKKSRVIGADYV